VDVNVSLSKATVEEVPDRGLEAKEQQALPERLLAEGSRVSYEAATGPADAVGRRGRDPRPEATSPLPAGGVADLSTAIAKHRKCRAHHVRLGLTYVKHVGEDEAAAVVAERERGGPYRSFDDLARRVGLKEEALRSLALVGAFDALGEPRRALLSRERAAHRASPAFVRPTLAFATTAAPSLPALTPAEVAALDYRITGVPTGPQVMSFYRAELDRRGVARSIDLAGMSHGRLVQVAGAVVVKQHPETAKGHVFLSLEDEVGIASVIVRPATYRACKPVIDTSPAVVVEGVLQHVDGVVSVLARRIEPVHLFVRLAAREWQ
jgi:error-prone DNA polymerase